MEKFCKSKVEKLSSISLTCSETIDQHAEKHAETKEIEKEKELLSSAKIVNEKHSLQILEHCHISKLGEQPSAGNLQMVHGTGEWNTIICCTTVSPKKSCGTKSLYLSPHRWIAGVIVPSRNLYARAQTISYTCNVILPSLHPFLLSLLTVPHPDLKIKGGPVIQTLRYGVRPVSQKNFFGPSGLSLVQE